MLSVLQKSFVLFCVSLHINKEESTRMIKIFRTEEKLLCVLLESGVDGG